MTVINLTPHPIRIYPIDTPDRLDPKDHAPLKEIPPSPDLPTARIGEIDLGAGALEGVDARVAWIEYTAHGGLVHPLPDPLRGVWYVVSLVVAMQQTYIYNRSDLLVPYSEVRTLDGTMIGCRMLARPV
jgi:hypothetical protein